MIFQFFNTLAKCLKFCFLFSSSEPKFFFSFFVHWFKPGYIEFYVIPFLSTSVSYLRTWRGGNHCCLWEHSQGKKQKCFSICTHNRNNSNAKNTLSKMYLPSAGLPVLLLFSSMCLISWALSLASLTLASHSRGLWVLTTPKTKSSCWQKTQACQAELT